MFYSLWLQRDGNPVFPGHKSVSFLNNNISPKLSSGMNGMCHITGFLFNLRFFFS